MTVGGVTDKAGKSIQILPKAFPFTIPALNIRIAPIAIDATSAHGILLKVEDFRIRHPVQNLPNRPERSTFRADQGRNSSSAINGHRQKLMGSTDNTRPNPGATTLAPPPIRLTE